MKELLPYKERFEYFQRSKYVPYPGARIAMHIHTIHEAVVGHHVTFDPNCNKCITDMFHDLTPMFLDTIERDARTTIVEQMNETPKDNAVRPRKSPSKGSGKKKA